MVFLLDRAVLIPELGSGWLWGWNLVPLHGQQSGLWKLYGENIMYKTEVEVAP